MRKLVYLAEARADLRDIALYVARRERSRERALAFTGRLRQYCVVLAGLSADLGRLRPEFGAGLRSTPHMGYLLFFRYVEDRMEVVAIVHGARDLDVALRDRNVEGDG